MSVAVATTGTGAGGPGSCTGLPANAVYYSGATTYTPTVLSGSLTASYTSGAITQNTCQFNCASWYSYSGSACISNPVVKIAGGNNSTWAYGLKADGTLWRLGATTTQVSGMSNVKYLGSNCLAKNDGTAWCYNVGYSNIYGSAGNGTTSVLSVPVQVTGLTNVSTAYGIGATSCASKSDGTAWCWGYGYEGELGNNTT